LLKRFKPITQGGILSRFANGDGNCEGKGECNSRFLRRGHNDDRHGDSTLRRR